MLYHLKLRHKLPYKQNKNDNEAGSIVQTHTSKLYMKIVYGRWFCVLVGLCRCQQAFIWEKKTSVCKNINIFIINTWNHECSTFWQFLKVLSVIDGDVKLKFVWQRLQHFLFWQRWTKSKTVVLASVVQG